MKTLRFVSLVAVAALTLLGCDAVLDCNGICTRYSSCYDTSYDVPACESRCRAHSLDDTSYRRQADQCNACISGRACIAATFSCGVECSTVVP